MRHRVAGRKLGRTSEHRLAEVDTDALDKLAVFSGVREFPVRVKCATLAWHTLVAAMDGDDADVSTEA